jgi:CBS domain-containing protein
MEPAMQVKDVMTSPVISVEPDASIWQAVRIMLQRRISGLPVIDKHGRLVGSNESALRHRRHRRLGPEEL